jgi:hypothetical protein
MNQKVEKNEANTKLKSHENQNVIATVTIRIKPSCKQRIDTMLAKLNKDRIGKKVKADELIEHSLSKITETALEELSSLTLSNKDKIEMLFAHMAKTKRGLTREDFWGMLIEGKDIS